MGSRPIIRWKKRGSNAVDFETATGIEHLHDPNDYSRLEARRYVGDETVGYKVALCERDVAIYASILFFGLLFGLTGRRFPQLHWSLWILLGLGPVGLDGFSQLFSQFDWQALAAFLPYRESTPFPARADRFHVRLFHGLVCLSQYRRVDAGNTAVLSFKNLRM